MTADQTTLLKRAIIQGVSERYECELAQSKVDVTCSQDHLQKISQVLGFDILKLQKAKKRKIIAAVLVLAAALAIGSLTTYAYRDQIREMIVQIIEGNFIVVFPGEQSAATLSEHYEIGYIPEGYELTLEEITMTESYYQWCNAENQSISFCQVPLNADIGFDGEHGSTTIIEYSGVKIYCRQYENSSYYVWNDGKYVMEISDRSGLSIDEIKKIIESITIKQ